MKFSYVFQRAQGLFESLLPLYCCTCDIYLRGYQFPGIQWFLNLTGVVLENWIIVLGISNLGTNASLVK